MRLLFLLLPSVLGLHLDGFDALDDDLDSGDDGVDDVAEGSLACIPLRDRGSHFTATVKVGKPRQTFDLVADMGSSDLIVPSCKCTRDGNCPKTRDRCYNAETSTTAQGNQLDSGSPAKGELRFSEGKIKANSMTDQVKVGRLSKRFKGDVFAMTDYFVLWDGAFEGVFGLGLPNRGSHINGKGKLERNGQSVLQNLGVARYTACRRESGDGVLKMGTQKAPKTLKTIGVNNWIVQLHHMTAGKVDQSGAQVGEFCYKEEKKKHGCAVLPDLGTTGLMGPPWLGQALIAGMCDQWGQCKERLTSDQALVDQQKLTQEQVLTKEQAFHETLAHCSEWMSLTYGLREMPPINFHLTDDDGTQQTLSIQAKDYVMVVKSTDLETLATENAFRAFESPSMSALAEGDERDVCVLAVGDLKVNTRNAASTWVLGLPLFAAYTVGFDQEQHPPEVSFTEMECGSCDFSHHDQPKAYNNSNGKILQSMKHAKFRAWRNKEPPTNSNADTARYD